MKTPPAQRPSEGDRAIVAVDLPDVTAAEAFAWFTQPERLTRWWPEEAWVESHVGGRYRLAWPRMQWELVGEFLAYEPGARLIFTWRWTHEPDLPIRFVDINFEPLPSGSRVFVTHSTYGDTPTEQAERQSHIDGWRHFLGRLQEETSPLAAA